MLAAVHTCLACGAQYEGAAPPSACAICSDDRQYVPPEGQRWLGAEEVAARVSSNPVRPLEGEPGVWTVGLEPKVCAIGQQAFLVQGEGGAVLWDLPGPLAAGAAAAVRGALGGGRVVAIAVSHPHFYTAMADWADALGCSTYIHAADARWVTRPCTAVVAWEGERRELAPGLAMVRLGGHFPGSCVLHWSGAADGRGVVFAGDTIFPAADRRWATFMRSFPNYLPLPAAAVRRVAEHAAALDFDRLYGAFPGQMMGPDARAKVLASAERYCRALESEEWEG